ncbi:MAG: AI-2E family transporter, partial [Saprospiraceae bacterium]|nr:AI-2E family transporter [Saprospiraceae bacterium]
MFLDFLVSVVPRQYEANVREAVNDTTFLLSRYFGGIVLQMAFVATFLSIGLFVIGVSNAILVAVFAALIYIVPYFGPLMGCLFAFSVAISSNLNLDFYTQTVPILWNIVFLFGILQIANEWFIAPTIFSKRILAHPLEIFIITLIGA